METSQPQESDYLKAWALFFLSATVGGGILGAIIGAVLGFILAASGHMDAIKVVSGIAGFVVSLPISYFTFRFFVGRLVARFTAPQPPPLNS